MFNLFTSPFKYHIWGSNTVVHIITNGKLGAKCPQIAICCFLACTYYLAPVLINDPIGVL